MTLRGIVYMYDISQPRVNNHARMNFEGLGRLCGKRDTNAIILTTTKWPNLGKPRDKEETREQQLSKIFWKTAKGAKMERFENDYASARKIIDIFLADDGPIGTKAEEIRRKWCTIF